MSIEVWYKLNDEEADIVTLKDNAVVAHLRDAIKEKWGDHLACAAPQLKVFAAGADPTEVDPREPYDPIPTDTTGRNPLIVVSPQQDGELRRCSRILVFNVHILYRAKF